MCKFTTGRKRSRLYPALQTNRPQLSKHCTSLGKVDDVAVSVGRVVVSVVPLGGADVAEVRGLRELSDQNIAVPRF